MSNQNQKNLFVVFFIFVFILIFFFSYFQVKLSRLEKAMTLVKREQKLEEEKPQPFSFEESFLIPAPEIKVYSLEINSDFLSPASLAVNPEDKLELKLQNKTEAKATFRANPNLGIEKDIPLEAKEEKSLHFKAPKESGEYKFLITTLKGNLEGFLMVK